MLYLLLLWNTSSHTASLIILYFQFYSDKTYVNLFKAIYTSLKLCSKKTLQGTIKLPINGVVINTLFQGYQRKGTSRMSLILSFIFYL